MNNVVVITTEPLPVAGSLTTGAGLRAWGLAMGLMTKGFPVTIITTATSAVSSTGSLEEMNPRVIQSSREKLGFAIESVKPAVIVMQHWGLMYAVPPQSIPLVIDLAGPHLLERRFWGNPNPAADLSEKLNALARSDFLVCGGEVQKNYFIPYIMQAGFDVHNLKLPVIPFSVPPSLVETPRDIPTGEPTFIYGGAFLAWQNPELILRIALEEMDKAGTGRLLFYGGTHPELDASAGQFNTLSEQMQYHPRVEMRGWQGFDKLVEEYQREGHVALDLMARNVERELAFTTRTMVYLACGLPVLYNDYSELSAIISQNESGWILPHDNDSVIRELVADLLTNPAKVRDAANHAKPAASLYTWDKTIEPLAKFCANPETRTKKNHRLFVSQDIKSEVASTAESPSSREFASFSQLRQMYCPQPSKWLWPFVYVAAWIIAQYLRFRVFSNKSTRAHFSKG